MCIMLERLLTYPGFVYRIGGTYYYLGKWICKECTSTEVTDCVAMYEMCRLEHEDAEAGMYFHKLRAYSDFALDVPYNPALIKSDMTDLVDGLSPDAFKVLDGQMQHFAEDYRKYCGELPA